MANILHIDQDENAQQLIQSWLGEQHNIIGAVDGPTAIQYCAMIQLDIILLNLSLPGLDGSELATRLQMFMPHTPILPIATPAQISTLPPDFANVLTRPLTSRKLRTAIQALLPPSAEALTQLTTWPKDKATQQFEAQIAALNQANKRLASLNAISALIGTSLDLEHLTDEILAQIDKTITFDSATLFLLKGDILEAAASRGFLEYQRGMNTYNRNEHNSAWRVVRHKLPLIIQNVTESDYWEPRPELANVKAWLGVPLIYKDRVVGVLTLDKNETHAFSDADARYLFTLAYQVAIAVENAQLFQELEKQSTRLKLINEVVKEISTIFDVDELFKTLGQMIFERLKYDQVAIFGVDESRTSFILKAIYGEASTHFTPGIYQQPFEAGIIGQSTQREASILINDISQYPTSAWVSVGNIQSKLITPIFVDNQVGGVIDVGRNAKNGFGDQDLWTLSSLANQAATVIENARLYREVRGYSAKLERAVMARTQRLQAIKKISQVVSQGLAVDELLTVVGRGLGQIFSGDTVKGLEIAIGLLAGQYLKLTTIYSSEPEAQPSHPSPISFSSGRISFREAITLKVDPQEPLGYVLSRAKPIILHNSDKQTPAVPSNQKTLMMVPLITGGKTIGLIRVKSEVGPAFDESDLETLESLAFQVAGAIEHARLLQRTRDMAIAEERTRLASDMHDGVAQNLAYLMLQVDRCLGMVAAGSKLETHLEKISNLLAQNIDELRRNIFDLRSVELEGKTIFTILENFVTEFGQRWGIKTNCIIADELVNKLSQLELSPEVESSLYRILQETLSNARQHAHSTHLVVNLGLEANQWVTLKIEDNGCGFDVKQIDRSTPAKNKGLGLVSMHERAERSGGALKVESVPGKGTSVLAKLPLRVN